MQGVEAGLQEWNSTSDEAAFAELLPDGDAVTTDQDRKNDELPPVQC
jgi:hypothetical protein